uniref:Uncharacterized protein n=1 Tax=Arundo donax TaxID=35708 RepID=A0A0A9D6T0_ARUDO
MRAAGNSSIGVPSSCRPSWLRFCYR